MEKRSRENELCELKRFESGKNGWILEKAIETLADGGESFDAWVERITKEIEYKKTYSYKKRDIKRAMECIDLLCVLGDDRVKNKSRYLYYQKYLRFPQ